MTLLLGSQSPRRREILEYFSLPIKQVPSSFSEENIIFSGDPGDYVCALADAKADELFPLYPTMPLLTADTIVYYEGHIFPKPRSEEEAFTFFKKLSGSWHTVYTGVAVRHGNKARCEYETTRVRFNVLTDAQIRLFHATLNTHDKAGGYTLQGIGSLLCEKIEGCYYNVMGLPINTTARLLNYIGIDLWDHLS
jgi:septum formation protein